MVARECSDKEFTGEQRKITETITRIKYIKQNKVRINRTNYAKKGVLKINKIKMKES